MATVLASFGLLVAALLGASATDDQHILRLPSSAFAVPGADAFFDYVVVGGGTAGLTVASRLAETGSVAVVEAGGVYQVDNGNQSVVPFYTFTLPFNQQDEYTRHLLMDWDLLSEPQEGAGGRVIHYAQGKTLGGSSAINTLAYHRPSKGFFGLWAEAVGDDSFLYENVLPYYQRSTQHTPPNEKKRNMPNATVLYDDSVYGDGPLQVSYSNYVDVTVTWLASALESLGIPLSPNGLSSGEISGYGGWTASTMSPDAKRSTSQTSYLDHAIDETRLMVYPHTQATKILIGEEKATGVQVSTAGMGYTLNASKEVIVSAGTFHSPQLLMVSGIGPRELLESHNIPVVSELPGVGQNLWDHLFFDVMYPMTTPTANDAFATPEGSEAALRQYLHDSSGPLSYGGGYISFEKLPAHLRDTLSDRTKNLLAQYPDDWPEAEYIASAFPGGNGTLGNISGAMLLPNSRGNVTIATSSMSDKPVINMRWLMDPADEELVVAILKRCREAFATGALEGVLAGGEVTPGSGIKTDKQILEYVRMNARAVWHPTSTCAMGRENDTNAVVDTKARVFGVSGLRVVDASIFPFCPPGHPQSSVYMLAEKLADDIVNGTW